MPKPLLGHFIVFDVYGGAVLEQDCTWEEAIKVASEAIEEDKDCDPIIYGPIGRVKIPQVPAVVEPLDPNKEIPNAY